LPQVDAIQLVAHQESAEIARIVVDENVGTFLHDWQVKRVWGPGYLDTTHLFYVGLRLDGALRLAWLVDTGRRSVQRIPTKGAEMLLKPSPTPN
jgi:hypothetical protein